jgi:uncharacterized protein YbjT (DUF2867 family)
VVTQVSRPPVLLLGASSQIGIFVLPRLLAAGYPVIALSRAGQPDWYPDLPGASWQHTGDSNWASEVTQCEWILSAGPIHLAEVALDRCTRPRRAVVFSSTSVLSKAASRHPAERELIQGIKESETRLAKVCAHQGTSFCLLRPTMVYGLMARWIERFGFAAVAGEAAGLRQPVHAEDLAATAVSALSSQPSDRMDTPLCGGELLTFRDLVIRIFEGLGRKPRIVGLPSGVFASLVRLGSLLPVGRGLNPEMVRRQAADLVFDDAPARQRFGHHPRGFHPCKSDFALPLARRLRILASSSER